MSSVFNSAYEVSLRILFVLLASDKPKSIDMISAMDFISVYGRAFGIADVNLHGDNFYKYGEFSTRRTMVKKAIIVLIQKEMVDVYQRDDGYYYQINDAGEAYCESFKSDYAVEYAEAAKAASVYTNNKSEREIFKEIISRSTADLYGGYDG